VKTPAGTDITFSIQGRSSNHAPGYVEAPGSLGSPPDAEINIAPIETTVSGRAVIDGSIPVRHIGLLEASVTLVFKDGAVVDVEGEPEMVETVNAMFDRVGPKARILGEFGIGLNPLAELCGVMLEDEGTPHAQRACLIDGATGRELSYAQVARDTLGLATVLASHGVTRGDKICFVADNSINLTYLFWATWDRRADLWRNWRSFRSVL